MPCSKRTYRPVPGHHIPTTRIRTLIALMRVVDTSINRRTAQDGPALVALSVRPARPGRPEATVPEFGRDERSHQRDGDVTHPDAWRTGHATGDVPYCPGKYPATTTRAPSSRHPQWAVCCSRSTRRTLDPLNPHLLLGCRSTDEFRLLLNVTVSVAQLTVALWGLGPEGAAMLPSTLALTSPAVGRALSDPPVCTHTPSVSVSLAITM